MTPMRRRIYESESSWYEDARTGVPVRRVTGHDSVHHQPFFLVPAYDDAMTFLWFVSHRTGRPEIFAEDRATGRLIQMTDQEDLRAWSIHPSRDGRWVYYTAASAGYRVEASTGRVERVLELGDAAMTEKLMVAAGMGTTALSPCGRWWAVKAHRDGAAQLLIVDVEAATCEVILERDTIAHMQFCPDDSDLLFYAGPFVDRIWTVRRDGSDNRRHHERRAKQWITHESWIPGRRELAFVDWPHGVEAVHVDTGARRRILDYNAWHPIADRTGTRMVADTNRPDRGIVTFPVDGGDTGPIPLCLSESSNQGEHWWGPFPYEDGPVAFHAPQHTHPHPSFAPDGRHVVFSSDRSGSSQIYEVRVDAASNPGTSKA